MTASKRKLHKVQEKTCALLHNVQYRDMDSNTCAIFTNAFNYSVNMTKFYVGLAKTNRAKPGVHAAQLRVARKHAQDARRVWPELRAAGATLNRHAA